MNVRDELIQVLRAQVLETEGGNETDDAWWVGDHAADYADAILARFPYMSADRSLYDYADRLRTQLNAANAEIEKEG